jgi:hypothetical protein
MAAAASLLTVCFGVGVTGVSGGAAPGQKAELGEYRVLEPLRSGSLTLFPVVRSGESSGAKWDYITLDEGLRSGEVIVTEYGKLSSGMVRPRHGEVRPIERYQGDRVNTLVLVNNSDHPLLLLAGEIVSGGKQDRVIGKDRIVPAHSDPIDLSVFCIEHGRWVESSDKFGAVGGKANSFMVQPSVRSKAMVKNDQQQVWASVSRSVAVAAETVTVEAAPSANTTIPGPGGVPVVTDGGASGLNTTSYAKAMSDHRVQKQVDKVAEPLSDSHTQVLQKLRAEHAVGVVVAVNGELIWADIFATPEMLAAYWNKLVRSYAAESYDKNAVGRVPSVGEAQQFIDRPAQGSETTEGETGIYRYREIRGDDQSTFYLQVLMEGHDFYAHISRAAEDRGDAKLMPVPAPARGIPID